MATDDPGGFGVLLRRYRLAAGLTQQALAQRAGLSARGIADLERGARRRPYAQTVARLAAGLQLAKEERAALAARGRTDLAWASVNERARTAPSTAELPVALSSFVGRERELLEVGRLLKTVRLLTLTGAGGVGKTRLALEVARTVAADDAEQPCLVELASVADSSLVPQAMAAGVGLGEQSGRSIIETLVGGLSQARRLIILDNCEHVLQACAELVDFVLRTCPGVSILATSRQRLGIAGETIWRVPSLAVPDEAAPLDKLRDCEAARLFIERAAALSPGFTASATNGPALALVCRRLDGIPLAIELAAARVNVLAVEDIAARLDDSMRLLVGGSRTAPARQQTLHATFAWSYGLLEEAERTLLARLSVFVGGWTLDAAEHVCSDGERYDHVPWARLAAREVLDLLGQLIDKSLVVAEPGAGGAVRYRLLEPLRQFLVECFDAQDAAATIRRRHALWFAKLAQQATAEYHGPLQFAVLTRLEQEHANLRVALQYLIDQCDAQAAEQLAEALWWFWLRRDHWQEGRAWLERLLARNSSRTTDSQRAKLLVQLAGLAALQGDFATAAGWSHESLAMARQHGDITTSAYALGFAGRMAIVRGQYAAARRCFDESLLLTRQTGERFYEGRMLEALATVALHHRDFVLAARLLNDAVRIARGMGDNWTLATLLITLGDVARARGDYARAGQLYSKSMALHRRLGTEPAASLLHNLGYVALHTTDLRHAAALFGESLQLYATRDERRGMAECLIGLAGVAAAAGDCRRAVRLLGAAEATFEALAAQLSPSNRADYSRIMAVVRADLPPAQFTAAWRDGQLQSLDNAVDEAFIPAANAAQADVLRQEGPLTSRERQIAALIARGCSNREIAQSLVISEATTERHVANIFRKLGFRSRAQVATWATQNGLLQSVGATR